MIGRYYRAELGRARRLSLPGLLPAASACKGVECGQRGLCSLSRFPMTFILSRESFGHPGASVRAAAKPPPHRRAELSTEPPLSVAARQGVQNKCWLQNIVLRHSIVIKLTCVQEIREAARERCSSCGWRCCRRAAEHWRDHLGSHFFLISLHAINDQLRLLNNVSV